MNENSFNEKYAEQMKKMDQIDQQYEGDEIRERLGIISDRVLAAALNVTVTTLATWRGDRKGPPYTKPGKNVFYRLEDIRAWLDAWVVWPKPQP